MSAVLSGVDEVLARIDQVVRDNSGEPIVWGNDDVLGLLAQLRHGLVNRPEWSQVAESNLRHELNALKEARLVDAMQMDIAGELYRSALRQVEGERDRARATAVRLEQELAEACRGNVRRFS